MSKDNSTDSPWAERHRNALSTRYIHENVLTDRKFELLLEARAELPESRAFEARFIYLMVGRLGLRTGEIAHFRTQWIDWDQKLVHIPQHETCGCGYCHRQAAKEVRNNENLTESGALCARWHPTTVASARASPFDLFLVLNYVFEIRQMQIYKLIYF